MQMTYLTQTRTDSLKQYLADCASGTDTVKAWNDHKARMEDTENLREEMRDKIARRSARNA